mgnify:CR=1 FL=1
MSVKIDYAKKIDTSKINPINPNEGIDVIYLTGAGYIDYPFKGISRDSALGWEEAVWGGDLTRSTDFVLTNILSVDYGLVARLEISYKYMNVQQYKVLMDISKQRVCYATYFNRETGTWIERQEMAFTGNELGKLYAFGVDYIGTQDVKIKLVATNRDKIKSEYTIKYNKFNNSSIDGAYIEDDDVSGNILDTTIKWSENINYDTISKKAPNTPFKHKQNYVIDYFYTADTIYRAKYLPNQEITVFKNFLFGTMWKPTGFGEDSWTKIAENAQAGKASTLYKVGDEKTIYIENFGTLTFVILGFEHDDLVSGGKAKMSIGVKGRNVTFQFQYAREMNNADTNSGGWNQSIMRIETMQEFFDLLPSDLKARIKPVIKKTSEGNQSANIISTNDKLWLFSKVEVTGTTEDIYKDEGMQYEYWKTIRDGTTNDGRDKFHSWWFRSADTSNSTSFLTVSFAGEITNYDANDDSGIAFNFCI